MDKILDWITGEQFDQVIDALSPCMDDFLFVFDLQRDCYHISQSALERFRIREASFSHATEELKKFIHPDDYEFLLDDIDQVKNKKKDFHNLQYRWLDHDGNAVWINCRGRLLCDKDGQPEYMFGCINEIARKWKADNVSGLLGKFALQKELEERGEKGMKGFLIMFGLDDFKEINESKGIDYGDMVLRKTAECIQRVIYPDQKLFRAVADEFIVADFSGRDISKAVDLYEAVCREIKDFIAENCYEVVYTVSAGIVSLSNVQEQNCVNLMKRMEFATNSAKVGSKNKYCIYDENAYQKFMKKRELIRTMRRSVNHGFEGFELYYQPIMDIKKQKLSSAEALLRFSSTGTEPVSPMEFIPLLEESGLIIPVGKWVLDTAMSACKKIQERIPDFRVSVNLSYVQVLKSNVLGEILSSVMHYGLKPGSIMIELTESGFLEENENFLNFCEGLKRYGILLALDDFGTGYSNFRYLYNLSPHVLKIDRSFTLKALQSDYEYNLLWHMANMTRSINTKFCIEGIETSQELEKICGIEPDYIQGYYFGKPCPYEEFNKKYVERSGVIEDVG